jgi:hypothetical protein
MRRVVIDMKRLLIVAAAASMALPAAATAGDYDLPPTNAASAACKAERARMGTALFKQTYGTNKNRSNALGKCISKHNRTEKANQASAAEACKAEQADPNFAATHGGKTFDQFYGTGKQGRNADGKCVSRKAKAESEADVKTNVNAAKTCKALRKDDNATFVARYGTKRNAFGKCVSATAKANA